MGTSTPGAFIPAAERYGLMSMVDRWVIETALADVQETKAAWTPADLFAAIERIEILRDGAAGEYGARSARSRRPSCGRGGRRDGE